MQKRGMEENQFQEIPQTFAPGRSKKSLPKKTIILIVFIVLITVAVLFVKLSAKSEEQQAPTVSATPFATEIPTPTPIEPGPTETPTPTPEPTATPTPSPKPSANPVDKATGLDRSQLNVLIQNGSGEAGVASKASDYLKGLGYDVASTGNADNYDYANVTIQVKADKSDYLALLKKDLGLNYTIENASSDLPDSSTEDALVIIGK